MKTEKKYLNLPGEFWALVKYLGQKIGYTKRNSLKVKAPSKIEIVRALEKNSLKVNHLFNTDSNTIDMGKTLVDYFNFRARMLNDYIEPRLMEANKAKKTFENLREELKPTCPLPMNKQKGEKKTYAYLTGIINMIIEANSSGYSCDYDPRELTYFAKNGKLLRTFSRRVDGAFPSVKNPIAIWEIKEYYYTTTFGSRIADGVYETILDGMEILELKESEDIFCQHLMMLDSYFTWWNMGRSYLCRIVDMMHQGYVDEVLFGYEVVEQLPEIVRAWRKKADQQIAE